MKHLSNRWWRLNNLYWIKDKAGRSVKFQPNRAQATYYQNMHYMNIILKARQLGFTTYCALHALDLILFNSNTNAGFIAHKREDADNIFIDKIIYAYDRLPDWLLAQHEVQPNKKEAGWLILNNNSSIRVSTSMRSGTVQYLHVSEFGKICAQWPEKAREIVTGAGEAVPTGAGVWTIESTAEGANGYFYRYCMEALAKLESGAKLTDLDFKMHFFPWWQQKEYCLPDDQAEHVIIPEYLQRYFDDVLEGEHNIFLTMGQKAWYSKKLDNMQSGAEGSGTWDDLKREHPSYPREAFELAVTGAYYTTQFSRINKEGRIAKVPLRANVLVDTWWDLGVNDHNCIWFTQTVGKAVHVIDFYQNSGEGLPHYANVLRDRATDRGYVYGKHTGPHDIAVREWSTGKSRLESASDLGINFEVAQKLGIEDGIEAVRRILSVCYFDEKETKEGTDALKGYKKEWDGKAGTWKNRPKHDQNSHPSDAFRTFAVAHEFEESWGGTGSDSGGTADEVPSDAWG